MFLSLHVIFSLEIAAVVCAILEIISGFDRSLKTFEVLEIGLRTHTQNIKAFAIYRELSRKYEM